MALSAVGLDLDRGEMRALALVAQGWAGQPRARDGRPVAPSTYNQRLAIVSSFYAFARRRGLLDGKNPTTLVDRRAVGHLRGHGQRGGQILRRDRLFLAQAGAQPAQDLR